jgi:predicted nuclease with TOPRIM domain
MLTKHDLNQIKKVVRDEVSSEGRAIKSDLKSEITRTRVETSLKISNLANRVKDLEIQTNETNNHVLEVKKGVKKIDKKFKELFDYLDKDHMQLVKRVVRIEDHLDIQPAAGY